jgi:thiol-disulfide isomerase/thioredoxin
MNTLRSLITGAALSALVGIGCAPATMQPTDSGVGGSDASAAEAGTCRAPTIAEPCSMEGCKFAPLNLPYCDGSGEFDFYGQTFCSARVTLVVISAGWCVPCQQEAAEMEREIVQPYAGRVRVVTVYSQGVTRPSVATASACMAWKNRYRLTSHMLLDANEIASRYFPNQAFPANLIIDGDGTIRHRVYGTSRGLQSLKDQIDGLLGN